MISTVVLCLAISQKSEMPKDPQAKKVLQTMFKAYADCKTYQDTGIARSGDQQIPFKTFFTRPNRLYVEFVMGIGQTKTVVWCNGGRATKPGKHGAGYLESYFWEESDGTLEVDDLEMSLAGATGISLGGASTIPGFLFPTKAYGVAYTEAKDYKLSSTESCDGQKCDVLTSKKWNLKVWISKSTHLVMREDTAISNFKYRIDFHPVVNREIPLSQYDFKPPKK